jgi:hypothetical protein
LNSNKTTDTSRYNGEPCSQVYSDIDNGIGVTNNNFNYQNMIEYVNGLGDYWIRLVEQMVPATTIWNTGVKYENSIFHRQKFVWRRQAGCNLVPARCNPCSTTASIFPYDCASFSTSCPIYPWQGQIQNFNGVLGNVLTSYLSSNGLFLTDCQLNTLVTTWTIEILIDNQMQFYQEFFTGYGYSSVGSTPSEQEWLNILIDGLDSLENLGYSYYLTNNEEVVVYNSNCSFNGPLSNIKINVGINFNIVCS